MPVVSKREAMAILGISKRTLERRLADGTLASHVAHGRHGPERRVHLPDPPPVPPAPTPSPAGNPGTGVMAPPPPAPLAPGVDDRHLATLALLAAADTAAENARLRAERDALRAEVAALRRPWWRRWYNRLNAGRFP